MSGTTRRAFFREGVSCAAHLALASALAPAPGRRLWAQQSVGPVIANEPFGRLERVADGIWALISTPFSGDLTTISNGGIIAGRSGVVAIEGFMSPEGARWLATKAKEVAGRWPTHVVVTHYHADHSNGVAGYLGAGVAPAVYATGETVRAVLAKNLPADDARRSALSTVIAPDGTAADIDLGGRRVRLLRRRGHTASDLTVEVDDPSVVFTGDLVWNAMFPNYVDAAPTLLADATRALRRAGETTYVPGHGAVATDADVGRYLDMLGEVEQAARVAHASGTSAVVAGAAFKLSPAIGEWALFNPVFFQRAFEAWNRELSVGNARPE